MGQLSFNPTDEPRDVLTYSVVKTQEDFGLAIDGLRHGLLEYLDVTLERDGVTGKMRIRTSSENVFLDPSPGRSTVHIVDHLMAIPLTDQGEETAEQLEGYLVINTEVTAIGLPAGSLRLFPQPPNERN